MDLAGGVDAAPANSSPGHSMSDAGKCGAVVLLWARLRKQQFCCARSLQACLDVHPMPNEEPKVCSCCAEDS